MLLGDEMTSSRRSRGGWQSARLAGGVLGLGGAPGGRKEGLICLCHTNRNVGQVLTFADLGSIDVSVQESLHMRQNVRPPLEDLGILPQQGVQLLAHFPQAVDDVHRPVAENVVDRSQERADPGKGSAFCLYDVAEKHEARLHFRKLHPDLLLDRGEISRAESVDESRKVTSRVDWRIFHKHFKYITLIAKLAFESGEYLALLVLPL